MRIAHESIRECVWKLEGWYFYIDVDGNVHTSMYKEWDFKYIDKRLGHNHWLSRDGMKLDCGYDAPVLIESFKNIENE